MARTLKLPPELTGPSPAPVSADPKVVRIAPPKPQVAPRAKLKRRHHWIAASFAICVALPGAIVAVYLYLFALPQYASTVAFSVRDETSASPMDLLGGLTDLSGSASKDADVLYAYIHSQQIVQEVSDTLDLATIWAAPRDAVFSLKTDHTIEDLRGYWQRMIGLHYDSAAGLIEVRSRAFTAQNAETLSATVLEKSRGLINALADTARRDAMKYATRDLTHAQENLQKTRTQLTAFRIENQILDPATDVEGKLGLLNSLQAQKAQALIDYDLLQTSQTRAGDPRLELALRRIEVVDSLIAKERSSWSDGGDRAYSELMAEYEALIVDLEFAQAAYLASKANFETAQSDALRTTKYLAAHIQPTRAERAEYPKRFLWLAIIVGTLALFWAIGLLIYYSVRDRR